MNKNKEMGIRQKHFKNLSLGETSRLSSRERGRCKPRPRNTKSRFIGHKERRSISTELREKAEIAEDRLRGREDIKMDALRLK